MTESDGATDGAGHEADHGGVGGVEGVDHLGPDDGEGVEEHCCYGADADEGEEGGVLKEDYWD